jgi:hypothetical protein
MAQILTDMAIVVCGFAYRPGDITLGIGYPTGTQFAQGEPTRKP